MIGIVGGLGPYAGVNFLNLMFTVNQVKHETEHPPVLLLSNPLIPDRSDFLEGKSTVNPAHEVLKQINLLINSGATIIAIPCNQIFAPAIFQLIEEKKWQENTTVLNLLEEVSKHLSETVDELAPIGVLARTGAVRNAIFNSIHSKVLYPDADVQDQFDDAIASEKFGLKYHASVIKEEAIKRITAATHNLMEKGASTIVLGCSEMSLAVAKLSHLDCNFVDTSEILARASLRAYSEFKKSSLDS